MKKYLGIALSLIGAAFATASTTGCAFLFLDEPKMPKSLIK